MWFLGGMKKSTTKTTTNSATGGHERFIKDLSKGVGASSDDGAQTEAHLYVRFGSIRQQE